MVSSDRTAYFLQLIFCSCLGLGSLPFLLVGPYLIFQGLPHQFSLKCDRVEPSQINCEAAHQVLGLSLQRSTLETLKKATVDKQEDDSTHYQVLLNTQQGQTPFGFYTSEAAQAEAFVADINRFIQNPDQPTLTMHQSQTQLSGIFVGSGFIGLSLFLLGFLWQSARRTP